MKILVLGGAGMLGHKVVQRFSSKGHELSWTLRGSLSEPTLAPVPLLTRDGAIPFVDACDVEPLDEQIRALRPDLIVNCLGVIKQRAEAENAALCTLLNADLPHRLVRTLAGWQGRLIHISTDCVFDGSRGRYVEEDVPDAKDVYGRTKALGEINAGNAITLRTSIIGRELKHHESLLDWFLSQSGGRVRGYRRALWSGVTSLYLADLIEMLATRQRRLSGIFHVASKPISKYDLLLALRDAYRLDVEIIPDDSVSRDMTLVGTKFERATGRRTPAWNALIEDLLADDTPYAALPGLTARLAPS